MFDTGYPYIGLSNETYDKVASILERDVNGMECTTGPHWGVCRVKDKTCDQVNLDYEIKMTMHGYEFSIPLKNIAVYVNQTEHGEWSFWC